MFQNPGGDWHPGKGDNPRYLFQPTPRQKRVFLKIMRMSDLDILFHVLKMQSKSF